MPGRASSPWTASASSPSSRASRPPSGCVLTGRAAWTCPRSWRPAPASACSGAPARGRAARGHHPARIYTHRPSRRSHMTDTVERKAPTREQLLSAYRTMRAIREFEERVHAEFATGEIPGFVHLYAGEEASAVGVCSNLDDRDTIASTHRGHGHCIAKGVDVGEMMAEIYGRQTGSCHGKGGSMHIADLSKGMLGANGIVGGGPPLICGTALAAKLKGTGGVSVAFFGDGGSNQGTTCESMNLASVWNLPAVFVAENNGYAETTSSTWSVASDNIADRAAGFGMPGVIVDGFDFFA